MDDSTPIKINLGNTVEKRLVKFTDKNKKVDVRKIFDHHGPRLAAIALEKAETLISSGDAEDLKAGMDIIKTFTPKMYSSKDTEKGAEESKNSNVSKETFELLKSVIAGQNEILKISKSRLTPIKNVEEAKIEE